MSLNPAKSPGACPVETGQAPCTQKAMEGFLWERLLVRLLLLALLYTPFLQTPAMAEQGKIEIGDAALQAGPGPAGGVTLKLSRAQPLKYKSFELLDPPRLVLDVKDLKLKTGKTYNNKLWPALSSVRSGIQPGGVGRVVFVFEGEKLPFYSLENSANAVNIKLGGTAQARSKEAKNSAETPSLKAPKTDPVVIKAPGKKDQPLASTVSGKPAEQTPAGIKSVSNPAAVTAALRITMGPSANKASLKRTPDLFTVSDKTMRFTQGGPLSKEMVVKNISGSALRLKAKVLEIRNGGLEKEERVAANDIALSPGRLEIKPGASAALKLTLLAEFADHERNYDLLLTPEQESSGIAAAKLSEAEALQEPARVLRLVVAPKKPAAGLKWTRTADEVSFKNEGNVGVELSGIRSCTIPRAGGGQYCRGISDKYLSPGAKLLLHVVKDGSLKFVKKIGGDTVEAVEIKP